jgi:glycosyltransferase involved in cell wall biosynthesis
LFPDKQSPNRGIFNLSRAKALAKKGCDVKVIAPINLLPRINIINCALGINDILSFKKKSQPSNNFYVYEGVTVYYPKWFRLPYGFLWKYQANFLHYFVGKKVDKIIQEYNPDLIIGTWINPFCIYSKYIKSKHNIPFYALAEGSDILIHPNKHSGLEYVSKIIEDYCDLLIVVSEDMFSKLSNSKYLKKIKLIKNGFDKDSFSYSSGQRNTDNDKIYLVNVANFNYEKGQDILIKAMKLLGPNFELLLIGEGPLLEKCRKEVADSGLSGKITFTGRVEHNYLSTYLRKQNIFCLPSRSEGLPAAPLEAMAIGLPVVSSKVGGMQQVIEDGFNGFLCDTESPTDLAEKIKIAAATEWNRERISEWVSLNYGWDKWAANVINIYNSITSTN